MGKSLHLSLAMLTFAALPCAVSAQSVGDVVQGLDSKAYKLVEATDIISNGSFNEAVGEDNIIPGWYTNSGDKEVQMTTEYFGISSTGGAVDDGPYLMAKGNAGSANVQSIRTGWQLDANQSYVMSIWSKKAGDWSKLFLSANAVSTTDEIKQIPNSDGWTQTMVGFTTTEEKPYLVLNCSWLGSVACFDEAVLWKAEEVANTDLLLKTIAEADLLDEVVKSKIQTELANANNLKESTDISAVKEAIDALRQAIDDNSAFDSAVKALRAEIQNAENLGVGESDVADIEAALADASTTVDDVNTMLNTLNVLEFNSVKANYPYATPLGAWTNPIGGGTSKGQHWSGDENRTYFDKWNGSAATYTMNQTVTLPAGEYVLKAAGRVPSTATLTMYVDELSVSFPANADTGYGIDVDGNANFSADGTYANNNAGRGWEWRFIPFTVDETKDVALSAVLEVNNSWGSISDIELFSKSLVYIDNWKIAKASAETTLADEEYAVVAGAVRAALQAEVAKEEPAGGEEEYTAATQALKDAEAAFKAALPTYQSYASQVEIAKDVSADVTEYEALLTSETATVDELSAALSELNVLQYNAVGENYTLDVTNLIGDVSEWDGDMVTAKSQHWDGTASSTYWEQSSSQWSSSAWSVYKETKATLPAGKYVLKLTGRASDGVSAYASVNDEKVYLPSKGDVGFGVDVEGKANFSADGTYANNNAGRGWEWRFIPFELTEDTEVAFKLYAEANTSHQWVSITSVALVQEYNEAAALEAAKAQLKSAIDEASAIVEAKANVGDALFCIPESAIETLGAAVEAQKAVLDSEDATLEGVEEATTAMQAAIDAYKATPVNAPKADAEYTITQTASNLTMSLEDGVKLGENTTVKFEAAGDNTFYITNGNGEYVYYSGTGNDSWSMSVSADNKAAWTITAVGDGTYTIKGKNGFIGTDNTTVGSNCYGNKKDADEMKFWTIEEVAGPQIITPDMFEKVLDVDATYNVYYNSTEEASTELDIMSIAAALQIQSMADVKVYVLNGEGAMVEAANMGFTNLWFNSNGVACAEDDADAAFYVRISQTFMELMAGQNPNVVKENTDYNAVVYIVSGDKLVAVNIAYNVGVNVGINGISVDNVASAEYYTVDGKHLSAPAKGLNIVVYKMTDGTTKTTKVYIK